MANELEPNNIAGNANSLAFSTTMFGQLNSTADEDYYKFTVSQAGTINLQIDLPIDAKSKSFQVVLKDSSLVTLNSFYLSGDTSYNLAVNKGGAQNQDYYIIIKSGNSSNFTTSQYSINTVFTAGSVSNFEYENNDTSATSNSVLIGASVQGQLDSGLEEDWFSYSVDAAGFIKIAFDAPEISSASDTFSVKLYDSKSTQLNGFFTSSDQNWTVYVPSAGKYFVSISSAKSSEYIDSSYNLNVSNSSSSSTYENESNNSINLSNNMARSTFMTGQLYSAIDKDYYKINISKSGTVNVVFDTSTDSISENYFKISIIDSSNNIQQSYLTGKDNSWSSTLPAGTYYIAVEAAGNYSDEFYSVKFDHSFTNTSPTFSSPTISVAATEDVAQAMTLSANDADGDSLAYAVSTSPTRGTAVVSGNVVNYTPQANFNGSDSFVVTVSDGFGGTASQTVTVVVAAANDAPTFSSATQALSARSGVPNSLSLSATDVDGDTLTYSVSVPSKGTASVSGSTLTYSPSSSATGSDSFVVTASDGKGGTATQTVNATIVTNRNPSFSTSSQAVSANSGTAKSIVLGASDPDGDTLAYSVSTRPLNGTATISGSSIIYTSTAGYTGSDSFVIQASDGRGGTATQSVNLTVAAAVNRAPTFSREYVVVKLGNGGGSFNATIGASDADGDILTFSLITQPNLGSASLSGSTLSYSTTVAGSANFRVQASDGKGGVATQDFYIFSNGGSGNDLLIGSPDADSIDGSSGNDTIYGEGGADTLVGGIGNDTIHADASDVIDGGAGDDWVYFSSTNLTSGITVDLAKGLIGTRSGSISNIENVQGTSFNDIIYGTSANNYLVGGTGNDTIDGGDGYDFTYLPDVFSDSTISFEGNTLVVSSKASGIDRFDNIEEIAFATQWYKVSELKSANGATNKAPTFSVASQSISATAGIAKTVTLAATDLDGDTLTYTVATPGKGSATISGTILTYTPGATASGADSFVVTVSDGRGGSATQTINASISASSSSNRAPTFSGLTGAAQEWSYGASHYGLYTTARSHAAATAAAQALGGYLLHINSSAEQSDVYGRVSSFLVNSLNSTRAPDGGDAAYIWLGASDAATEGVWVWADDGTPLSAGFTNWGSGALGAEPDNFENQDYLALGLENWPRGSANGKGFGNAGFWNDVSVNNSLFYVVEKAAALSVSTSEDTAKAVTLSAADADGDALTYTVSSSASNGTTSVSGGSVTYTPRANYTGSDSFIVTASDGKGGTATQTINVTVSAVNDAPTFSSSSQAVSATAGAAKTITLAATDVDGDTLSYTVATPGKGSASLSGSTLTYTPTSSASGSDSFVVTASDGKGGTATQTINATISAAGSSTSSSTDFRLTTADGWVGSIGGNGLVYGTAAFQDISVLSGAVTFDASFNKGGDVVRFDGAASAYTVLRSGSSAQIGAGGSLTATIPIGTAGASASFSDGARKLAFVNGSVTLGGQTFSTSAAAIAAADGSPVPTGADSTASARLSLSGNALPASQAAHVTLGGKVIVYGTSAVDVVAVAAGKTVAITFDASFNKGGDVIILDKDVGSYSAVRSGSSIVISTANQTLTIPIGTAATTLRFTDADRAMLFSGGAFKVGDQIIGTTATPLTPSSVSTSLDIGTSNSTATVSGAGASVIFTDDATKNSFVKIADFGANDLIRISGASEGKYSFSSGDLDGDGAADDLSISFSDPALGVVNDIQILNAVSPSAFVFDKATAVSAVGFNFISFG